MFLSTARWVLDLLGVLQQPRGRLHGAGPADAGRPLPALFRSLPTGAANDGRSHRWLPADASAEDLQIPTAAGRAAQIHCPGSQVRQSKILAQDFILSAKICVDGSLYSLHIN